MNRKHDSKKSHIVMMIIASAVFNEHDHLVSEISYRNFEVGVRGTAAVGGDNVCSALHVQLEKSVTRLSC